jgi:hypothetical protein
MLSSSGQNLLGRGRGRTASVGGDGFSERDDESKRRRSGLEGARRFFALVEDSLEEG